MPIIKVENLSKKYVLSHQQQAPYSTLRDVITNNFRSTYRKILHPFTSFYSSQPDQSREDFWALKDVSFAIEQGDRIGVIGRNGAGKSTLLKVLSRITEPSKGKVCINGRVASLLEVGTGFHPELSGRENIFLNGAILGMKKAEIKRKFDEIVQFADVEKFLDTPVKHYSSGMYVRLAFSVAAHLEPEILVVDEVLAVGDAQFQKKCMGKMEDVSAKQGRTIIFVSHNLSAIRNLCSKAIYLDRGAIVSQGKSQDVINHYFSDSLNTKDHIWQGIHKDNQILKLLQIKAEATENENGTFFINNSVKLSISLVTFAEISNVSFEIFVQTIDGSAVFSSFTDLADLPQGNIEAICTIPGDLLNNEHYSVTVAISKNYSYFIVKIDDAITLTLEDCTEEKTYQGGWPGVVRPKLSWKIVC